MPFTEGASGTLLSSRDEISLVISFFSLTFFRGVASTGPSGSTYT